MRVREEGRKRKQTKSEAAGKKRRVKKRRMRGGKPKPVA
jgi:hypothetical protein